MDRRCQENVVILFYREGFEGLNDFWKKGIGNLGDDQPKNPASAGDQSACLTIGVVAKLGDGLPHAFCKLRINSSHLIHGTGNGCSRNLGPSRDIANIHESSGDSLEFGEASIPLYSRTNSARAR